MLEELLESSEAAEKIPFACRDEKDENLYHNEYCPRYVVILHVATVPIYPVKHSISHVRDLSQASPQVGPSMGDDEASCGKGRLDMARAFQGHGRCHGTPLESRGWLGVDAVLGRCRFPLDNGMRISLTSFNDFVNFKDLLIAKTVHLSRRDCTFQAVDTFNCGRFHGDPLPDGVTAENITAVRRLLANDYAESFQVTPHP